MTLYIMKNLILLCTVLFVVTTAFTNSADPSRDILGKWKIDESSIDGVTQSIIMVTAKTNPDLAEQLEVQLDAVKDMVRNMSFEYRADSTYEIQTPQGPQSGKWSFVDNNKYLLVSRPGKADRKDNVLEITATHLRLVNNERGDTTLYVRP